MTLTMKELGEKTLADVEELVRTTRAELSAVKFRAAAADLKDVRSIRQLRKYLARLLTRKNQLTRSSS